MKDPYEVLGVSPSATDAEIKSAYKELVKKYHPDQYQGNPLSEFAEEKMSEINDAYDKIMEERRRGGFGAGNTSYGGYGGGVNYSEIRRLIQAGNITQADSMLDSVSPAARSAEWYFLKGSVCYTRGWLNDAYAYFQTAAQMQPGNMEYQAALNQMNRQRGGYMAGNPMQGSGQRSDMDSACNCCSNLICADCCCEMMGGDLIPCC